ncbi:aminotransferase class I/II-fold pyridoxal phosphate-dependent enzyme [Xanthocytophaga agilis]|uniref:Aminotransferase class I/II-fold pyridoxal phosphate-dependent enzyme n=1 Tax=Xanthocytophaga agilis TaxID=3048010 RepID=A0AAE3R3L5_9BACT|nr:aminotransferase class I/II-fold pyridoxal phosphate-dependent enzyme [Xanthocytophaga agilis]MDJ1500959.1 aminotransferase class I/II-fold pyridoxal phosphate-dependent enzyme [Xanthocytophaga agilis]
MIQIIQHLPDRVIQTEGKEFLYFSGTSYLGISRNPNFQGYLQEGITQYGTNYSSSRISNIQLDIFEETEQYLATYVKTEAALTFSSGFLAGQAIVRMLQTEGELFYAPRTHPALWTSNSDPSFLSSYQEWIEHICNTTEESTSSPLVFLTNSLDPLYGESYDFSWLQHLSTHKRFILVVDDSHGIGVIGNDGNGIAEQIPSLPHVEVIIVGSIGKALGIPGGVVAGNTQRIAQLKKSPFFTAGSPIPPAYLYAFLQAKGLYQDLRKKLFENIELFQQETLSLQLFQSFPNYPVFYTQHNTLYDSLYQHQILISSFPYPSPYHPYITRIILNASHTQEDIYQLINSLKIQKA